MTVRDGGRNGGGRSGGGSQAERAGRSTDALLRAAAELVVEGGLDAMTFAAIGERAGYSRGLVTARFGSKAGLVQAMIHDIWERLRFLDLLPQNGDRSGLDSVLVLITGIRGQVASDAWEAKALMALTFESLSGEPALRGRFTLFYDEMRRALVTGLHRGIDDGTVRPDVDPDLEAGLVVAGLVGIAFQLLLDGDRFDADAAYAHLQDATSERLRPRAAG